MGCKNITRFQVEEKTEPPPEPLVEAAAPRRRSARTSNTETNAPVESPSEAKPAEPEPAAAAAPTAASFVEVENQLEKMFAGIEEEPVNQEGGYIEATKIIINGGYPFAKKS